MLVYGFGFRAHYAESNYYRDLQKLENLLIAQRKDIVLIGSSIAARINPDEFRDDLGFVNLGLDGTVALTGLTALQKDGTCPAVLLVELSHVMLAPLSVNDELVLRQQSEFNRWLWHLIPLCRPSSRPSSMLYSLLKRGKECAAEPDWLARHKFLGNELVLSVPSMPQSNETTLRKIQTNALVKGLSDFQEQGTQVMFIKIPMGKEHVPTVEAWQAAVYLKAPVIDLEDIAKRKGVTLRYTDGIHLDRASAQICSFWLASVLHSQCAE